MTDWQTERLAIEHECAKLVIQFFNYNDARDYVSMTNLFTEDGIFVRPSDPSKPIKGRATILDRFGAKPKDFLTRHLVTNIEIMADSNDAAHGLCYVLLYTGHDPEGVKLPVPLEQTHVGASHWRFVRTSAGWRIAENIGSLALTTAGK